MAIDDAVKRVRSYDSLIEKYAGKYNVPSNLVRAAMLQESGGNPQAVSDQGAKGLMQIMPETFERLGGPGDPFDPETSIDRGTKYYAMHLEEFGTPEAAVAAYHQGEGTTRFTRGKPAGPKTRHYVQTVMANLARFNMTEQAMNYVPSGDKPTLPTVARAHLLQNDDRLPVIAEGLRTQGKTLEEFKGRLQDPAYVDRLYNATLRHAEAFDTTLTQARGEAAYMQVLKTIPGPGEAKPVPVAPEPQPGLAHANAQVAEGVSKTVETVKQGVAGATIDVAEGLLSSAEDMGRVQKKFGAFMERATGLNSDAAQIAVAPGLYVASRLIDGIRQRVGTDPSKALEAWAEENVISKPGNVVDGLTRGIAGFLVPYLKMKQMLAGGVRVAEVAGKIVSSPQAGRVAQTAASAAVTAFQDPNDPLASEAIENLAMNLDPANPGVIRSWITRYITGELPEDELYKNFANRGLRAAEDTMLGIAAEGVFAGLRQLKNGWLQKKQTFINPHESTPPPVSQSNVAQETIKKEGMEDVFEVNQAEAAKAAQKTETAVKTASMPAGKDAILQEEIASYPMSQLARDLEIRQEIMDIEASQKSIPSTFATDSLHTEQGEVVLSKLNANPENVEYQKTAQDWLQSTRETTSANVSAMRQEVASRLSDAPESALPDAVSPVKIATSVEDIQGKVIEDVFNDPDRAAQNLSENRDAIVKDLTQAGMKPQDAQKFINETLELFAPPTVRDIQAAHATVETPPKGQTGALLQSLKDQGLDKEAMKAVVLAGFRGVAAATAAAELILPGESEAADGEMSKSDKIFAAAIVAALGGAVALKSALKIGKGLKKMVSMSDTAVSKTAGVKASRPSVAPVKPGISPSKIEATKTLSPSELKDPTAIFAYTNPRFDLMADATDLSELRASARALFQDVPNMTRLKYLNTPINSANDLAEIIGGDPKKLQQLIDRINTPLHQSDDAKEALYLRIKAEEQLKDLAVVWHGLPQHADRAKLAVEISKLHHVLGQLATGLELTVSDSARTLNLFKHASDGRLLSVIPSGVNAGELLTNPETLERYMGQLLKALEEPGGAAKMAQKMVKPTAAGAISQAFIHSLLGAVQTVANTVWSAGYRIALNPFIRLGGAVAQKYGPDILTGPYKPGESPEIEEFGTMMASIAQNFAKGVLVAKKTLITGKTAFLEQGASLAATGHPNVFVREAFGPIPKIMDQAGKLVGLPNAGNFFNYLGSFLEVVGTRGLVTVDEFTQFMVEQIELDAHAVRASKNPALNFKSITEQQKWMDEFKANPPQKVIDEIKYQKAASSYMNSLFSDRGAGSPFMAEMRKLAGAFENSAKKFPATRVMFPFIRTAMNVGQFTAELTPGANIGIMWNDLKSADPWVRGEAQGRVIASLGLATTFALMGASGSIRGILTSDPAYRRELEMAGTPENSIDWGGRTWKINTREPIGFLMAAFGQLGASMSGESVADDEMGAAEALWSSVYNMLQDHHFAGAIAELMHDINPKDLDQKIERLGLAGIVVDTVDDLLLRPMIPPRQWQELISTTDATKKVYDTYWEKIKARTWPEGATTETDIMRRPRWAGSGLSNESVNNAIKIVSGVNQDRITQDPLSVKLTAKNIHIPDPRPSVSVGPVTVPISKAEQQQLRWIIGHPPGAPMSLYEALSQTVNDPMWDGLSDAQADLVVDQLVGRYMEVGRQFFIYQSEDIQKRLRDAKTQKRL